MEPAGSAEVDSLVVPSSSGDKWKVQGWHADRLLAIVEDGDGMTLVFDSSVAETISHGGLNAVVSIEDDARCVRLHPGARIDSGSDLSRT